jgi:hypothetical protein
MGSLREALFLTIWLKRQESELLKVRMLAEGSPNEHVSKTFSQIQETIFPFLKGAKSKNDEQQIAIMKKEVEKGVITFDALNLNPLRQRAANLRLPDDFRDKLKKRTTK